MLSLPFLTSIARLSLRCTFFFQLPIHYQLFHCMRLISEGLFEALMVKSLGRRARVESDQRGRVVQHGFASAPRMYTTTTLEKKNSFSHCHTYLVIVGSQQGDDHNYPTSLHKRRQPPPPRSHWCNSSRTQDPRSVTQRQESP